VLIIVITTIIIRTTTVHCVGYETWCYTSNTHHRMRMCRKECWGEILDPRRIKLLEDGESKQEIHNLHQTLGWPSLGGWYGRDTLHAWEGRGIWWRSL